MPIRLPAIGLLVLLILLCGSCAVSEPNDTPPPRLAHHSDGGFTNPYQGAIDKTLFSYLKMRYFGDTPFAENRKDAHRVPIEANANRGLAADPDTPQVSWLGHSTFLIQYRGLRILTDPVLSDRASPFSFMGPKRLVARPIGTTELPAIDYVIISHNHYDHLDTATIQALGNQPKYLVPLKLRQWLIDRGIDGAQITEHDWWDSVQFDQLTITATPSQHWSGRGLFDRMETLWASWHIAIDDFSLWFAGDTGYNPYQFREIGERWQGVDLALIPIGAYAPRWFMKSAHINPEEAVQIHRDVRSRFSIGMHWGTFQLTAEPMLEPVQRLQTTLSRQQLPAEAFVTLAIGETRRLPRRPAPPLAAASPLR